MAYIGAQPKSVTYLLDTFSGNASQQSFTLRVEPVSKAALLVFVDGARKTTDEYTVVGKTLTFTSAPASGTNNIQVVFLGLYAAVNITTDASISTNKLVDQAVTTGKIADEAVTTNKLANNVVTTIKVEDYNITSVKMSNTGVTSGTYGNTSYIPTITVDQAGRITNISNTNISISSRLYFMGQF